MKEADSYFQNDRLARGAIDLQAEFRGATEEHDRRVALMQLRALDAERKRFTDQIDALETLPAVWQTIYGEGAGYLALFAGARRNRRLVQPQEGYFPYPDRLDDAQRWARTVAATDRELYMCAHLTTAKRRRKETAAPLWALYADVDDPAPQSDAVPTPSLVVESSPGRFHAYWCLTEPVTPVEGEGLNRQLALRLGADATGWDTTQLLRVPGGFNHKYPDAPLVKVLAMRGHRYDPATIAIHQGDVPLFGSTAPEPATAAAPVPQLDHLPLTQTARRILAGELPKRRPDGEVDRSASLMQMARILAGAGYTSAAIAEALAERDASLNWHKYSDRADGQRHYDRIAAHVVGHRRRR
jgi:hypothetical protein